jgi:L-aspartate oxidase
MAGKAIIAALIEAVRNTPSIRVIEGYLAEALLTEDNKVTGLQLRQVGDATAKPVMLASRTVVLATGGIGHLYAVTTNPAEASGLGLAIAARAGAVIADPEFVQFHPTAIMVGRDPAPLATEALRGEGAILIDDRGARFMPAVHADAELAPRDVVARALHRRIAAGKGVFLDCRDTIGAKFERRFPTVHAACMAAGIDPAKQPIPVAPAAHYHMGGIASDAWGRSSLSGLWVVGECAATGLHGANRLASNSLLEGLVFGARVADEIKAGVMQGMARGEPPAPKAFGLPAPPHVLRAAMTRHAGLERDARGLGQLLEVIGRLEQTAEPAQLNMLATARLVAAGALERRESRGGHWRQDFPLAARNGTRTFMTLADARVIGQSAVRRAMP